LSLAVSRSLAVAAVAMAVVLRFMIEHWSLQASVLGLAESVAAGVVVYTAALLTLWLCSGRPPGPSSSRFRRCAA